MAQTDEMYGVCAGRGRRHTVRRVVSAQDGGADGRREWCLRKLAAQAHGWANGPAHDGGADTSLAERCLRKMAAQTLARWWLGWYRSTGRLYGVSLRLQAAYAPRQRLTRRGEGTGARTSSSRDNIPPFPLFYDGHDDARDQPARLRLSTLGVHSFLLPRPSSFVLITTTAIPFADRPPSMPSTTGTVLALLLAPIVGLALVALRFGRPPRTMSIKHLGRWIRVCYLRILVCRLFYAHPPTLDQIRLLDPLARVAALAEFPDSYANDGCGATYVAAVVKDDTLGAYLSGHVTAADFLAQVRVKVGEAGYLPRRQQGYRHCNSRQTHLWLFCFYPDKRKAAEKMCHFSFLADAPRAPLDCSCGKTHTEYWWLRDLGSFAEVEERVRVILAHLGQPDLVRQDLRDVWLLSLLGFLSAFLTDWTSNRVV
ncbi:hypothetical protein C8F04DRAFT_1255653 [Mycena alexandri]|uniref:Uncharacterized protein n=1 Tax=Mycena alexandri TaxID=1745969 RepID=A0AAD6T2V9_9AGAR|nr:hypothetical protein C8F04DRAFT_1255653 [Mycena alexandri]